ncbi:ABC transporter, putative [Eimeria brunetti]|uniref:ABC transporter, putative n=1 Tax=Eimeria brunetti TaxID=51314 RepID=U6LK28_9EIME|nr:ABC transporter, putative [Eimeria brunetti]
MVSLEDRLPSGYMGGEHMAVELKNPSGEPPKAYKTAANDVNFVGDFSTRQRTITDEQLAAACAAVNVGTDDVSRQESVKFELTLDEVSCTLPPRRSCFDLVPLLSSLKRTNLKDFLLTGQLRRVDARPLEPILHPLSAVIRSGSLVAIMGPSGCGKTTLMGILSGRSSLAHSGQVAFNGRPPTKEFDRLSSYVSQDDIFDGNETVVECLQFSYRLRTAVPRGWGPDKRKAREREAVQRTLSLLGLTEVQANSVGNSTRRGISGGQKRRLTLGIGLMSDAKILLCDEPTTGLSAADAQLVVDALRRLCVECGMAVVAVIHQPSHAIMRCFDHLLLLSHEGRCVYNGRVDAALRYFSALGFPCPPHQNPADLYLDLVSQGSKHAGELADLYEALMKPLVQSEVDGLELAGPYVQFREVGRRSLRLWLRSHSTLAAIMGDSIVQGLVIGSLFFGVRSRASVYYQLSALFLMLLSHLASSLWTVPLYVQQKAQYRVEVEDGFYSPVPYMFATSLVANFFVLVGDAVLVTIMWLLFGFPFLPLLMCYLVGSLGFVICDSMTAICSLASTSFAEANASATLLFMLLMFVNGFATNPASLPYGIAWVSYLSPFFLVFEGLAICILETYEFRDDPSEASGNFLLHTKEDVYETFGIAGRAYGHRGSALEWLWAVDVVLLLLLMVFSKALVFTLQATIFLPKRYRGESVPKCRFPRFSVKGWPDKFRRP